MKTKAILFLFLLFSAVVSAQVKRVAILETVDKENKVSYANKLILRANLSKAITNTAGYEAYDRTDIDAIMGEQNFQRTGLVSNDQIKRLGEMTGANYILVAEAVVVDAKTMFITAKLLDVETARTIMTDNMMMGITPEDIQKGCITLAKNLFHEDNKATNKGKTAPSITKIEQTVTPVPVFTDVLERHPKSEQKLMGVKKYTYGNMQMDENAFRIFLRNNSPEAYKKHMSSQKLIPTGWGLLGGGIALLTFASIVADGWSDWSYETDIAIAATGFSLATGCIVSSVPILCIGYARQKNAINIFNEQNSRQQAPMTLNLQASQNGIGLALNF